jgi:hypothetical protein
VQKHYLVKAVRQAWDQEQQQLIRSLEGKDVVVLGECFKMCTSVFVIFNYNQICQAVIRGTRKK